MLGFVQNFVGPKANPIGITFGSETLRAAQVLEHKGETRIIAAASRDVPNTVRENPSQRLEFFASAIRDILAGGGFRGRQVVLGLPSSNLSMVHLRLPVMDEGLIRKAILFEATGKLPYHPTQALIRHIVAGQVYDKQEQKMETILMASPKAAVEEYLTAARRSKLDVVAMCAEPLALVECFCRLGRRREDTDAVSCYIDIGATGTRMLIALGRKVLFARAIGVGGDDFTRALAKDSGAVFQDAKLKRMQVSASEPAHVFGVDEEESLEPAVAALAEPMAEEHTFAGLPPAARTPATASGLSPIRPSAAKLAGPLDMPTTQESNSEVQRIFTAIKQPLDRLVSEIEMCRRYHDATFPAMPVQRVVFAGGEARQRSLCANIAQRIGLPAAMWDPVARLAKDTEFASELGLDPNARFPDWTVAVGLSMGVKE